MRQVSCVRFIITCVLMSKLLAENAFYVPVHRFFADTPKTPVGIFLGWVNINDYRIKGEKELVIYGKHDSEFIETCFRTDIANMVWEDEDTYDGVTRTFYHETSGKEINISNNSIFSNDSVSSFPLR